MKNRLFTALALLSLTAFSPAKHSDGWIRLFNGKNLDGWRVGENAATFSVEKGMIVAHGETAHLFYKGKVAGHDFKNFMFRAKVMTRPGSNSGIYFHTDFQEKGWPAKGYEIQVNNTHTDWRKTAGIYAVKDVKASAAKDNEWFTEEIIVQGKRIVTKVNGKVQADYTEPDNVQREKGMEQRILSHGTFALQGHDPESVVYYKDIEVKPLP